MSRYQHTKGQIKDNAIEALLHDPLFRLLALPLFYGSVC